LNIGSWRKPGGEFSDFLDHDIYTAYSGIGIRLIHKKMYNAVLGIDYGFNMFNANYGGFVVGVGQYF
jgi:hypothetical protein